MRGDSILVRGARSWHNGLVRRLLLGAVTLLLGCEQRSRPWDQPDAAAALSTQPPPAPIVLPHLDAGEASGEGGAAEPDAPASPVRVGGPWVRCYGGFHPT